MDRFKQLRRMYDDAGVKIYAWKALSPNMGDEEFEYVFNVAEALGCTHTTLELPTDVAQLKRIGAFAEKRKIYAAYHTHLQGSMTAFDQAFEVSKGSLRGRDGREPDPVSAEVPRSDRERSSERSADARPRRRQPAVGHG
jgi:hypothetical protein